MNTAHSEIDIKKIKEAGRVAAECLKYGESLIKLDFSVREVLDKVEEKIKEMKALPAFPAQISINEAAAHQCSDINDTTIFQEGDLVKLDVGVHVDGYIGDNALTVDFGSNKEILRASREALNNAIKIIAPGTTLSEIGRTIEETIKSYNLKPVKNLSGHGLGHFDVHTKPTVPNYYNKDNTKLREGMLIAIEPFATDGDGLIQEKGIPTVHHQISNKGTRNQIAKAILADIITYNNLPFAKRWIQKKHGENRTNYALSQLEREGIIKSYPPLLEVRNGMVSQAEHSVYVSEKPIVTTKI